jgi:2'-5' RNA ligase
VQQLRAHFGLEPQTQPLRAHLTLARPRGAARVRLPLALAGLEVPGVWTAGEVLLFESQPQARPRYRVLARAPLEP